MVIDRSTGQFFTCPIQNFELQKRKILFLIQNSVHYHPKQEHNVTSCLCRVITHNVDYAIFI